MNHSQKIDDNLRYLILRYCGVTLAFIFISGFMKNIFAVIGLQNLSSSSLFITPIFPAIDAGFTFVRRFRGGPEKDEVWLLSAILTAVGFLVSFAVLYLLDVLSSENLMAQVDLAGSIAFAAILLIIMAPLLVITRLSVGFGAKIELSRSEKMH